MKRRQAKYYTDIDNVLIISICVLIMVPIVWTLVVCLDYALQETAESVIAYNQQAEQFNTLPKAEREICQPFCDETMLDDDLYLKFKDMPTSAKESFSRVVHPWFFICWSITTSIITFAAYWSNKSRYYYLADLPLDTVYGWFVLFFILPVGWPFLLISRINMWYTTREENKAERGEIQNLAQAALTQESNIHTVECNKHARRAYIWFRTHNLQEYKCHEQHRLNELITNYKCEISDYGQRIANLQRKLGETKAELKRVEDEPSSREATKALAESEWQQILEMRGVAKITAPKRRAKHQFLTILLKVRVPYKNNLYDFGDYEVTFDKNGFKCRKVRSGVKLNRTNSRPVYSDRQYGFCFGSRLDDILSYARSGHVVEALTLVIDCLHSVNPGDEEYIPGCYRKVRTVERAKRRLQYRQFFQKGGRK